MRVVAKEMKKRTTTVQYAVRLVLVSFFTNTTIGEIVDEQQGIAGTLA
jgi:hypothetical protein